MLRGLLAEALETVAAGLPRQAQVGVAREAGRGVGWCENVAVPGDRAADGRQLVEVAEYRGEASVIVAATQLGSAYSEQRKRQIVDEWVEFFRSGPTPIRSLRFTTRTPKRLFDALSGQHQLTSLEVKWGDYNDLSALSGMPHLRTLRLAGASKVENLAHLAALQHVETLQVDGLQGLVDASPLGRMRAVKDLELGGDWMTPRNVRVQSLSFLAQMPQLERLLAHTLIVDDLDYTPLLSLPNLKKVRVMATRGMTPPYEQLVHRLPWDS
ncbi:hypothetical protein [Kribbella sp. HUAS MG21]|uniref:Leucine-rich repeat domain-containing protein n=1 Tax=Kribbella sp. HUAS MG21 TaxID=3160966 RepID=A0AAU7TLC3_9ACTN